MKTKSFDRRKELLEAALGEFSAKSYEEASLNNIIKNAGISKGTFYYHFQDKQALYLTLLQSAVDAKLEFVERKLKNYSRSEELSFFENLKLQGRFAVEFAKDYPSYYLLGIMFRKESGVNEIYDIAMSMLDDISDSYFDDMLEHAMKRGEFRDGLTLQFIKKIMTFNLYRHDEIFEIDKGRGRFDFDRILIDYDSLIDFLQRGLGSDRLNK
jgi:AcrR family transcriptional regulator